MNKYARLEDLPDICKGCKNRDWDSLDEYSPSYNYCTKNLILPTKSGKCRKYEATVVNDIMNDNEPTTPETSTEFGGLVMRLRNAANNASLEIGDAWNLLDEAADRITELEDNLFSVGAMNTPPCFCCGYNGPGYHHPSQHECAERHHRLEHIIA